MGCRRAGCKSPITNIGVVGMMLMASLAAVLSTAVPAHAATPGRGGFVPITPFRLVDTRAGSGAPYSTPPFSSGETRTFNVYSGRNGQIPANAVGSLALNVTAVTPILPGFLTVWPADESRPTASVLNYAGGDVTPNAVTVKVSSAGAISVYAQTAPTSSST